MTIKKIYPDGFKVYGPPYTKVELLDIYKRINAAPVVIYSDRYAQKTKSKEKLCKNGSHNDHQR